MADANTLTWSEHHAFSGPIRWRIKDGHLRFDGTRGDGSPRGPYVPQPVIQSNRAALVRVLRYLEVPQWRTDYDPSEAGWAVADGFSWRLNGELDGMRFDAGGANAFPSFADARTPALELERYYVAVLAFHRLLAIPEALGFDSIRDALP